MRLFELKDRPVLDKVFPRSIMPQIRKNNLEDSGYEFAKGKIKLSKLKPVQDQRVQGMHDRALRGFQDGSIRPIIIDKYNYIVNGHHRYDVARSLDLNKVKVIKVNATIEELIDDFSDTSSDAPTIEEQFKAKLQQKLNEIHSAKPYDNMDDNGLINFRYQDATGPQEFGEEGHLKLAPIPGISKNEVYDNGVSRHIFLMNNKEPIFLLTIKRGLDGWVTTNVVTHSNYRGKGFAVPVYLAVSKAYGQPLYSFGTQSPAGHKIWQNLAKQYPNRVTGYDVTTKQEVPFSDVFDGKVATRAKLLPETKVYDDNFKEQYYKAISKQLNNENLPIEIERFVNSLVPSDVGKDIVGDYIVHYEGFADECNDGHDENSIDQEYAQVYQDFDNRQGQQALIRGVAYDNLGVDSNPVLYSVFKNINEGEVVGMNPQAKKPFFSPEEADRANAEWNNQAQVDQGDGVILKAIDGKQYRIMTSYGNQHFEDGEVYLDGVTNPNYIDTEGYPDAAELLYYHSATGHYPEDEDYEVVENYKSQDVTKQGRNLSAKVKQYLKGKKTQLTTVKVSDLDMDTPGFDRIIGDLGDVNFADTTDPIVVDADGKTILDGFHRVQKAKDIGKEEIPAYMVVENFKDGKKKGKSRPGRVKRAGASCKGSVTSLRKKAKNSSGEKAKMYHWCANMKAGRKKK